MKRLVCLVVAAILMMTLFPIALADTYVVNTQDEPLNIRTEPQGGYDGILRPGTLVDVISIKDGWASFMHNGKVEYLYAEYLRPVNGSSSVKRSVVSSVKPSTPKQELSHYEEGATLTEVWMSSPGRLIIRESASEKAKCLNRVSNGTVLYVVDEDDIWAKVVYKDGYAFVKKNFLVRSEECAPVFITYQVKLADETVLNVRTGPGNGCSVCDFIKHGQNVDVSLIHDGWAKITYNNGKIGYVQVKFLVSTN